MNEALLNKYQQLLELIKSYKSVVVAYSSGVDSTFLLYSASIALKENCLAVTATSNVFPVREKDESNEFCDAYHIKHILLPVNQLEIDGFKENPKDRCYICKKGLFTKIIDLAKEDNIAYVLEGSNKDDEGDYRPGLKAISELGIKSPLRELEFTKQEIRELSKYFNLPTYNKPSFACLASRFPYGNEITIKKLQQVEKAEAFLLDKGFKQFRVRIHQNIARIELLEEDFIYLSDLKLRNQINTYFKELGFDYVSVDLQGFKSGNMNIHL